MGIFDLFKGSKPVSLGLSSLGQGKQSDCSGHGSGLKMPIQELHELAKRARTGFDGLAWKVFGWDSVTGVLELQIGSEISEIVSCRCWLRPLDNPRLRGVVFINQVLPIPSGDVSFLPALVESTNELTFLYTGAAAGLTDGYLQFASMMLEGPDGFTKEKLSALISFNMAMSWAVGQASMSMYQKAATYSEAKECIAIVYRRYLDRFCVDSVKKAFEWGRNARTVRARS